MTNAESCAQWAAKNRGLKNALSRDWYARNRSRTKANVARWRAQNPEKHQGQSSRSRHSDRRQQPIRQLLRAAKGHAKRDGAPFAISETDLLVNGELPVFCPYLGLRLDYDPELARHDAAVSIDKIVPSKGYVPGNVLICSWLANRVKGFGSLEQLRMIVRVLEKLSGPHE